MIFLHIFHLTSYLLQPNSHPHAFTFLPIITDSKFLCMCTAMSRAYLDMGGKSGNAGQNVAATVES